MHALSGNDVTNFVRYRSAIRARFTGIEVRTFAIGCKVHRWRIRVNRVCEFVSWREPGDDVDARTQMFAMQNGLAA
jgi:hypothetical protein